MQDPGSSRCGKPPRRLILGAAAALGLVTALTPHTPTVLAAGPAIVIVQADAPREPGKAPAAKSGAAAGAKTPSQAPAATPPAPPEAAPDADAPDAADADAPEPSGNRTTTIGKRTIIIEKGDKRVHVGVLGRDREYDSFEQFVQDAPWLAGLVFLTVLLVFLVPLLIIVLLIWYKIRKNRMANETMLKLAERGVVPTATAMDAVASGNAASLAAATTAPGTPAYEHARALQRRTVWSDLRKGVILTGAGLGLSAWSMFDDGSPNSIGLILMFVGLGYVLLWYLEDRTHTPPSDRPGLPPAGGP